MTMRRVARPPWSDLVVVCRKCARKAGRRRFAKELKRAAKEAGEGKRLRVVEVGCLDLCPKRRITLATAEDLGLKRLRVLDGDAEAEAVLEALSASRLSGVIDSHGAGP